MPQARTELLTGALEPPFLRGTFCLQFLGELSAVVCQMLRFISFVIITIITIIITTIIIVLLKIHFFLFPFHLDLFKRFL